MKEIKRDIYLDKLIRSKENGLIKVITGIKGCGKSYLLDPLFKNYLLDSGIKPNHIIKLELDKDDNKEYLDSHELNEYIKSKIIDDDMYYVLLDEIQLVQGFEFVLNGFLYEDNIDCYVTGSTSKYLSTDIITEFRGRTQQIRLYPLSYSEFYSTCEDKNDVWKQYLTYGGMPMMLNYNTNEDKEKYLKDLYNEIYLKEMINKYNIKKDNSLKLMICVLASSLGTLINSEKVYNKFLENNDSKLSRNTIFSYFNYLKDIFIIEESRRYNINKNHYVSTPFKYYFVDVGLRNVILDFKELDEICIIENIVYNELLVRGLDVDVGFVEVREKNSRKQLEVDFVCNIGYKRYYIQVTDCIDTREKNEFESKILSSIDDSFKKIIIVKDKIMKWMNVKGILIIGVQEFLLNKDSLDL